MAMAADLYNLRKQAADKRDEGDRLAGSMLELAAAIIEAVGSESGLPWHSKLSKQCDSITGKEIHQHILGWVTKSGLVLEALAKALAIREADYSAEKALQDGLLKVVRELSTQTAETDNELVAAACQLKQVIASFTSRAFEVGHLERMAQDEKKRLNSELQKQETLKKQVQELSSQRNKVVLHVEELQERLSLASSTKDKLLELESQTKKAEQFLERDRSLLKKLEIQFQSMSHETKKINEHLGKTKLLLEELERSSEKEILDKVRSIWATLPRDGHL